MMVLTLQVANMIGLADGVYQFGALNKITGRNGAGKTSLARAMYYALTGFGLDGAPAADSLVRDPGQPLEVALTFSDETALGRRRTKTRGAVLHAGQPLTEADWLKRLGVSPEALGLVFFPGFFFAMDEATRREIFLEIAPPVDALPLLAEATGVQVELGEGGMDVAYRQWADRRLTLERQTATLRGQAEELQRTPMGTCELEPLKVQHANAQAAYRAACEHEQRLGELQRQHRVHFHARADFHAYLAEKKRVEEHNASLSAQQGEPTDLGPLQIAVDVAQKNLAECSDALLRVGGEGAAARAKLESLAKSPGTCPFVGEPCDKVPDSAPLKAEVEKLRKEYGRVKSDTEQAQVFLKNAQDNLAAARERNASLAARQPLPLPTPVEEPAAPAEPFNEPELAAIKARAHELAAEVGKLSSAVHSVEQSAAQEKARQERLQKVVGALQASERDLEIARRIEAALHPKTGVPALVLQKMLAQVTLPGFRFVFSETLKNGTQRDCFKVEREDGTPVDRLSSGERVKFCLALSQLVADLTRTPYRCTFLENADLVDAIPRLPNFQIFVERVAKGEDLKVQVLA